MDKVWAMVYYSVLKSNELLSYEKTWRNLKCKLLSERNQLEKTEYQFQLWNSGKVKTMETIKRPMVAKGV